MFRNSFNFVNVSLGPRGFTIFELILTITLAAIALSAVIAGINAGDFQKQSRDDKRLNDMNTIERAVLEYRTDIGVYPDGIGIVRASNADSNPTLISNGWIKADLSRYNSYLPIDPINDETYHYSYMHNGEDYEINCVLEILFEKAQDDNGSDSDTYETGSNLSLL